MKTLKNFLIITTSLLITTSVQAQNKKKELKIQKIATLTKAIEERNFEFVPEYGTDNHGKSVQFQQLESKLSFKNGVISSYLPRVEDGTFYLSLNENGVNGTQFRSKSYEVTVEEKKGWHKLKISMKDCLNARQLNIDITPDGDYSTVRVIYFNGGSGNFTGVIKPIVESNSDTQTADNTN